MTEKKINTPLISVIVPIYNVERYLRKCINSIINQSYKNLEIILVNDGSKDNSKNICEEYKNRDSRITIINKPNGGLSDARNAGIDKCTGKYITFVDSDDYLEKEYIEYLYILLKENNADISICEYKYITETGKVLNKAKNNNETIIMNTKQALIELCKEDNFSNSAWAKLYLTQLFSDIRYPKGKLFEDIPTTYKLFYKSKKIVFGRKMLYNYLFRFGAISKQEFNIQRLDAIRFAEEMTNFIKQEYPESLLICNKRLFTDYIYTYKNICESNKIDENIINSLYIKINQVSKSIYSMLTMKMKIYYIASKLGRHPLYLCCKSERLISKLRF